MSTPGIAYKFWSGTVFEEIPPDIAMAGTKVSFYTVLVEHSRRKKIRSLRNFCVGSLRTLEEEDVRVGLMRNMLGI